MANQEQIDRLLQGVKGWNAWRREHPSESINLGNSTFFQADLRGAELSDANLSNVQFMGCSLRDANLRGAKLSNANLRHIDLRNTDLSDANLSDADLSGNNLSGTNVKTSSLVNIHIGGADLSNANLNNAILIGTNLSSTNLNNVKLSNATIGYTIFGDCDLRIVKGLETVQHRGPSPLSITTIYKSQGDIPEAFVRGCGVPNAFLEYMKALARKPIEYYTCFISYSSQDEVFVKRLYADLQQNGVRCWFAPEDIKIGDEIQLRIDETIRLFDKLLVVLSEHSITSTWVAYEVKKAHQKEPQGIPNTLYPIRIDDTILTCNTQWAQDIKASRHIGDFSHWKDHDAYQQAFIRLLRDLKAEHKS